jgi:hypothetical protein
LNCLIIGTDAARTVMQETMNAVGQASGSYLKQASIRGTVLIKGQCVGASTGTGNLILQAAKTTSGTASILTGSNFRVREVQF